MSLWDAILGRQTLPKANTEKLFAISTAQVTLEVDLRLKSAGKAGICFKPVGSSDFADMGQELEELLHAGASASNTKARAAKDSFGFQWVVLEDEDFEDLVVGLHLTFQTLEEKGFGSQLLSAVFKFGDADGRPAYWIYNYKRGLFYPFVPTGQGHERDNSAELHMRSVMEKELPIDPQLERWFPMWDMPL